LEFEGKRRQALVFEYFLDFGWLGFGIFLGVIFGANQVGFA